MGGVAGNIPSNFNQAAMQVDYVRIYQNTQPDTQAPINFTAAVGAITSSSVELLLNANDNSGTVVYTISYGDTIVSYTLPAGTQSVVIPNLSQNTDYTFTVSASDQSGNASGNNPVVLNATTPVDTGCFGTDTEAQQGAFSTGYTYTFETIGTDVKITCEMLDPGHVGVVAILWKQSPFTEIAMTHVSGNKFTKTITGQNIGSTIHYAVKFAYAGGLAVTKYLDYVVGSDCSLGTENPFGLAQFKFMNPAIDTVYIQSVKAIDAIEIHNVLGTVVANTKNTNEVDVRNLPNGVYSITVYSGNQKISKKLIVGH
jgi:hypothetical protein